MGHAVLEGTNVVSLGTYDAAENRTAYVSLRNKGPGDLHLERIIVTCKCMRVETYPRSLAPGKSGEIAVTILGNEVSGPFTRIFYVETDDPDTRNLKIKIVGVAEEGDTQQRKKDDAEGTPKAVSR